MSIKNEVDKNLYNEKSLNNLNIRELRDMGKRLGISSPTTMNKHDLIDYILKVLYGEVELEAKSLRGRPFSYEFDISEYISKLKKNNDFAQGIKEAKLYDYKENSDFIFKAASPKDNSSLGQIEQRVVFKEGGRCELRIRQFVGSDDDIKLDKATAKRLKLENFDVVEIIKSDSGIKIISINGEKVTDIIKPFKIGDENILAGSRKVFHLRTKEEIINNIDEIKTICLKQDLSLILFGYKNSAINFAENQDILITEKDNTKAIFKKIMMFVELCKQYIFDNKNFVVVIENQDVIASVVGGLEEDIAFRIKKYINDVTNDILTLGNVILTFDETKPKLY